MSSEGLITTIWTILLITIFGPVCVDVFIKEGDRIGRGPWGLVPGPTRRRNKREERRRSCSLKMESEREIDYETHILSMDVRYEIVARAQILHCFL
jgi:hypothetical protein